MLYSRMVGWPKNIRKRPATRGGARAGLPQSYLPIRMVKAVKRARGSHGFPRPRALPLPFPSTTFRARKHTFRGSPVTPLTFPPTAGGASSGAPPRCRWRCPSPGPGRGRRLERRQHAADVDHPAEHVAGAVRGLAVRGRAEARLPEARRLAARGVLDVHVPGELVGRAVGRVRVAGLAVDGCPGAVSVGEGGGRIEGIGGLWREALTGFRLTELKKKTQDKRKKQKSKPRGFACFLLLVGKGTGVLLPMSVRSPPRNTPTCPAKTAVPKQTGGVWCVVCVWVRPRCGIANGPQQNTARFCRGGGAHAR